jgi:surface polysaccharide O-acyltransferase-like enzyme
MLIQYINNLRAMACFLVILTHSAMPAIDISFGLYMVFFSLISSPSSELFVMISSSLLAPTKLDMVSFYKKRFSKLLGPFIFWSIIVLIINYYQNLFTFTEMMNRIILIPFVPATGIYWFVYTICGLYLLIPIISPWLDKSTKKELLLILSIWGLTIILPYLNLIFDREIYFINGDYYFILIYFGGFIGYLFLGVFLRKHPLIFSNKYKSLAFITILLLIGITPVLYGYIFNRDILVIAQDNLSITSVSFVIAIFCFFQNFKMPKNIELFFNIIAKYSFGIYLIHFIVIRDFIWYLLENNRISHPIIETPLIAITSLFTCLTIVKIISFFPKSKYIIGA